MNIVSQIEALMKKIVLQPLQGLTSNIKAKKEKMHYGKKKPKKRKR